MLSNPLQYSPQSLLPQFPGLQPEQSPFGFGQGVGQGFGQQFPFNGQANPYMQSQLWQGAGAHNPFLSSFAGQPGAHIPAHQIVPVLGQLAQQIAIQTAVAQQIGIAVHQLAHQLALQGQGLQGYPGMQGLQGYPGGQGLQGYPGGQGLQGYPGGQGGYGLGPQAQGWGQAWGASRQQTIQ